ncbi:hypothetical protein [Gelidibacter sp.]|uniref:hypothetical protein n=1 Tax=Gelidibacter sp. TaxID=2018083 RepID=UPI003266AA1A
MHASTCKDNSFFFTHSTYVQQKAPFLYTSVYIAIVGVSASVGVPPLLVSPPLLVFSTNNLKALN